MSRSSINPKRLSGLTWVGMGMFAAAGLSQARVQLFQRDDILDRATKSDRFLVSRKDFAKRGQILDRESRPLAQDEDTRFLTVQFSKTPRSPAFYMDLAAATGIPATEFAMLAESAKAPVDWKRPIGAAQVAAVQDVKQRWRADGVGLSRSGRRSYSLGEAAAGFLGAMRDKTPLSGVELGLNQTLSGVDGKIVGILDREGNYLPMRLDRQTVRRKDGASLTLTIDSELQQAAAEAVKHAVDANKADQGVAIVMDPKSGDILAMANWPSFDPNKPIEPNQKGRTPEFNGAYMSALEPGSTFKVLTLAKALDEGVVQPDDTYYCKGSIQIRNRVIRCDRHHGSGAHGLLDPEQAIARSCNLAAANWARKIGHDDFVHYMEQLGLMDKPGLGLPQESRGLYNYNDYTKDVQLATNGFGQSMNYTPLALASAFCMLGNDGKRVYPRLIAKVDDRENAPRVGDQVISSDSAHEVLHMMRAVFDSERGTAKSLRIPGYEIGGKTGTAQKKNFQTGDMKGGGYVSNFVGFVPADQPRAVIMVMVDNPKAGQYYGASVAGPVFRSIAQTVIRRMHIPPTSTSANESTRDEPLGLPEPKVELTPEPVVPKAMPKPKLDVRAKRISSGANRATKPVSAKAPAAEPRKRATVRVKEPIRKKSEPTRTDVPRQQPKRASKHAATTRVAEERVTVPNPAPKKPAAKSSAKQPASRAIAPRIDDLRAIGKNAEKVRKASAKTRAKAPAATAKPQVPPTKSKRASVSKPDQGRPKPTVTQAAVRKKRSTPDRVNR